MPKHSPSIASDIICSIGEVPQKYMYPFCHIVHPGCVLAFNYRVIGVTLLLSSFTFYLKINFLYAFVCIAYVQHGFSSIFLCCCSFHGSTFCGFTNSSSYHDQGWLYVLHRKLSTMHLLI